MHTRRQERGGIPLAQRVDRRPFRDPTCCEGRPTGARHPGAWHGGCGRGPAVPPTARGRTEPHRMAVGGPRRAEERAGPLWQGHRTVLGACATAPMDQHAGPRTIGTLQRGAFVPAQSPGVNGRQAEPRAQARQGRQEGAHLVTTEADRECLLP